MNEIVPRTPDRGSEFDDENSYVPETPQSVASPTYNGIPIPSLTRIRRALGVLENSPPQATPSLRQCLSGKKQESRCENCAHDNLHLFKRARVSLFHDKRDKERENARARKAFSINARAFYGGGGDDHEEERKFSPPAPVDVKPVMIAQSAKRKPIRALCSNASARQSIKRRKTGEINCGVGHGIKKPKTNKRSPNVSVKGVKRENFPKLENGVKKEPNVKLEEADSEYETIEVYDHSKKFFKCKYVTRLKAKLTDTSENVSDSSDQKVNVNEANAEVNNCETIPNSPEFKTKNYKNRKNFRRTVESSTATLLEKFEAVKSESNILSCGNSYNTFETDNKKLSIVLRKNNFNILETEKNIPRQSKVTENAVTDEKSAKEIEKCSIKDKQNDEKAEKGENSEISQSMVVNKCQNQINIKKDYFNSVECKECQQYNLIYKFSSENNNDIHAKYHRSFQNLKFQEWKSQRLIFEEFQTRMKVILIKPDDYVLYKAKLKEVLNLVTKEINIAHCDSLLNNKNNKVYLLVKYNIIVSISVAGITMIQDDLLYKPNVMFGISFIWTAKSFRRQKIASKLLNVMRSNFNYGYRIAKNRIAFSKNFLTPDGKAFARSYTKSSDIKVF